MKLKGKQFATILNIQKISTEVISTISRKDFQRSFIKLHDVVNIVFFRKKICFE